MKKMGVFFFLFSLLAQASLSAHRQPHQDWTALAFEKGLNRPSVFFLQPDMATAFRVSSSLEKIDFSPVSNLGSEGDLMEIFKFLRDTRFVRHFKSPIENRRLSWLYPDDGCFIRADLMSDFALRHELPVTMKIFAFGNLMAKTDNTREGSVRWWYHVAPLYRVGRQVYVLDPSLEASRPLTFLEWRNRMSLEEKVQKFSLCSPYTVDPADLCQKTERTLPLENSLYQQREFQTLEWKRIEELGRDPYKEL